MEGGLRGKNPGDQTLFTNSITPFELISPVAHRQRVAGDDDRNVAVQQTTDLVEKLRAQNVEFEELIFPDEIRDLLCWSDWVRAYRATAEFFDRRLANSGERQ